MRILNTEKRDLDKHGCIERQNVCQLIILENKFQKIFYICDEYFIKLFVYIYEVRKET